MSCIHFDPERFAKLALDKRKNRTDNRYCQILEATSIGQMKYFYLQERVFDPSPRGAFDDILLGGDGTSYSLGRGEEGGFKLVSKGISASSKSKKTEINKRRQDPDEELLEKALQAAKEQRASGAGPSNQPSEKVRGRGRLKQMQEENKRRGAEFDAAFGGLLEQDLASARNVADMTNILRRQMGPATTPQSGQEGSNRSFAETAIATAVRSLAMANRLLSSLDLGS